MGWQDAPIIDGPDAKPKWAGAPIIEEQGTPSQSTAQQIGRQGALAGRAVAEGIVDLAAIPANALGTVLNAGLKALGVDYQFPEQSSAFSNELTEAGIPAPESDTERLVNTIGRRMTGAAATMGTGTAIQGARGVTGAVGQTLASNPVIQGVAAATGPVAGELARQSGVGAAGQTAADLAGSIAPGVVASGAQMATRAGFRGGEVGRQRVEQNIQSFQRAGTSPSVGQATESRAMRGAESLLSRTPGGAGPMVRRAETQADELGAMLEKRASELTRKTSAEQAGRQIQRSISGEGGFIDTFKSQQGKLFDELDNFLPKAKLIDVSRTKEALSKLNAEIPGAPNVSKYFQNSRISGIERALSADTAPMPGAVDKFAPGIATEGKLPYEALKKLRTLVGNEMADAGIASDVPRSKWKALYAALSDDLKGAADDSGPQAQAAWKRANNYTRAGMRRIESIESVIDKNGGPEAIFRAATSNTKEGATTLRAVMQSLDKDGQKMVTATVMRRLGLAKAGVQGELGDQFSTETFLTNWNLLSTEAKRALFDRYGPQFRADMDQVAKVAANLRAGSQVFRNPSGTSQATTQAATAATFVVSVLSGNVGTAGAVAGGVAGANLSARLMVNPRFVRWLAQTTKVPVGSTGSVVNSLSSLARTTGDQDIALAAAVLEHEQQNSQQQTNGKQ